MKLIWALILMSTPLTVHAETWNQLLGAIQSQNFQNPNACSLDGATSVSDTVDLCNRPAETVCSQFAESTAEAVQNTLRSQVANTPAGDALDLQFKKVTEKTRMLEHSSGDAAINLSRRMLFPEQKAQLALIAKIEKNAMTKFHKTQAELDQFFEGIRKTLIDKVTASPEFARTSGADGIVPSKADVLKKLSKVKIQTAQSMASAPAPVSALDYKNRTDDASGYFDACGADGLLSNAYYDRISNTLKICPGILIQYLNDFNGKLQPLSFVLGHELGHAIDTDAEVPIQNQATLQAQHPQARVDPSSIMCYANFLDCIDTKYVGPNTEKFGTYSQVIDQLENRGLPALNRELTRLQGLTPPNLDNIARVNRSIAHNQSTLAEYKSAKAELIGRGLDPDTVMLVQKNEMTADFMGTLALRDQLKALPQSERMDTTINAFRLYCEGPERKQIIAMAWGNVSDAVHPPDKFRIEMLMRNPEIRRLLQCTPLQTPRPWCDLE